MQIRSFRADAVVMATGGNGLIFGKSTMSVICTGGALARCYQAGAKYANPEMIQVHPTAIPGEDKCRLISESARGEGGPRLGAAQARRQAARPTISPKRIASISSKKRTPSTATSFRATSPRAKSSRSAPSWALGVGGGNMVYLDLRDEVKKRQIGRGILGKLEGILEIYEKFVGTDPLDEPMKIFPAVHYSMGGLWANFKPRTGKPRRLERLIPTT